MKRKVLHIITCLKQGGAEKVLYDLLKNRNASKLEHRVISLMGLDYYGEKLKEIGVAVESLGLPETSMAGGIYKCVWYVRKYKPQVIQSWMYHADFFSSFVSILTRTPLFWGIHHASPIKNEKKTFAVAWINAVLSKWIPDKIIACSDYSAMTHAEFGYSRRKMMVVANGVDTDYFRPESEKRSSDEIVIGHVGRWHLIKNHAAFIKAAGSLKIKFPSLKLVMAGSGIDKNNGELTGMLKSTKLLESSELLGECGDIPSVMRKMDIFVSTSSDEAFGLVVAEALSCGVPCVVTKVGMCAKIVDEYGIAVPVGDDKALFEAVKNMIEKGREYRRKLGEAARIHIKNKYGLNITIRNYENLYLGL